MESPKSGYVELGITALPGRDCYRRTRLPVLACGGPVVVGLAASFGPGLGRVVTPQDAWWTARSGLALSVERAVACCVARGVVGGGGC